MQAIGRLWVQSARRLLALVVHLELDLDLARVLGVLPVVHARVRRGGDDGVPVRADERHLDLQDERERAEAERGAHSTTNALLDTALGVVGHALAPAVESHPAMRELGTAPALVGGALAMRRSASLRQSPSPIACLRPWDVSLISILPGKSMTGAARPITKPAG